MSAYPWECPRCRTIYAPWVDRCEECSPPAVTSTGESRVFTSITTGSRMLDEFVAELQAKAKKKPAVGSAEWLNERLGEK